MENYGFLRVAAASPLTRVGDPLYNASQIMSFARRAEEDGVSVLVTPELGVTGYTCADLFGQDALLLGAEKAVGEIARSTRGMHLTLVVGVPVRVDDRLYNCAAVIRGGTLRALVPKIYLPTYNEFYENRWFSSGEDFLCGRSSGTSPIYDDGKSLVREGFGGSVRYAGSTVNISPDILFRIGHATVAIEVCEDLWTPIPPSSYHALSGAQVILNLSASNEVLSKHEYRKSLVSSQSARTVSAYVYCSCGYGESTQDLVFAGSSLIAENGSILSQSERFSLEGEIIEADVDVDRLKSLRSRQSTFYGVTPSGQRVSSMRNLYSRVDLGEAAPTDFDSSLLRHVEPHPFVPGGDPSEIDRRAREITSIQVLGLATRLEHIGCKKSVIGISGGLDSTLALLITVMAYDRLSRDRKDIIGVTMPGFGTTGRTYNNAVDLMKALGITIREVSIVDAVSQHFSDIGQDPSVHDVTYENCQARERTQILMDISNKEGGIVVGTGDLSELALGWCTYNGDHMSMYGVNSSIPKTLVKYLVKWAAENHFDSPSSEGGRSARDILMDIVDTPISPELTPAAKDGSIAQKTEDLVGPYELHDFFLYNVFRCAYPPRKVLFLARKAFLGKSADASVFVGPEGKSNTYDDQTLRKWLKVFYRRFFSQQFKRSCLPDGPKVGSVTLSPRGDWRMPSDAKNTLWLKDLEEE